MMARRRQQTTAEVFVESSAGLGAAIGLLRYAERPVAAQPARTGSSSGRRVHWSQGGRRDQSHPQRWSGRRPCRPGCAFAIVVVLHLLRGRVRSGWARRRVPTAASSGVSELAAQFALPSAPPKADTPRRPGTHSSEVWRRDRGQCVDCASRENLEFDHIIPVSRGGSNSARNIELRCGTCNGRKGARI